MGTFCIVQPGKRNIVVFLMVLAVVGAAAVGLRSAQTGGTAVNPGSGVRAGTEQSDSTGSRPDSTQNFLPLQGQTSGPAGSELFVKMMLSVLIVAALGVAAMYVSRKILPRITNMPGKEIRVIETAHLGPRKQLHLLEIGAHRVLIASSGDNVTMLADLTEISGFPSQATESN